MQVRLDAFEGPMDLLYHLIEKNEIDIYDIPIASLTEQYLEFLETVEDRDMDGMSEFLVMAATLLEIKSKLLLPRPRNGNDEAEADPREVLVQRLLEYKKIKDAADTLKEKEEEAAQIYYKEADATVAKLKEQEPQELEDILLGISLDDLYQAFRQVMARKDAKADRTRAGFRAVQKDLFTVGEKMEYIRDLLLLRPRARTPFHTIFSQTAGKMEKVVTFLALLELIKRKEVRISQETNFAEIFISKYEEGTGNEII